MTIRNIVKRVLSFLTVASVGMSFCMTYRQESRADNNRRVMVSMGDSYASGEGIEPFYGQDDSNKFQNYDWLAHRSENCWPGMLTLDGGLTTMSEHKDDSWYFVAASGAKTTHINSGHIKEYSSIIPLAFGTECLDPQINVFNRIHEHIDYVTLSIGGNDMGFSSIITRAVEPDFFASKTLAEMLDESWDQFYNDDANEDGTCIRDDILNIYRQIGQSVDSDTTIIVTGYPKLISEEGGNVFLGELISFSPEEAKLLNDSVIAFNKELQTLVRIAQQEGIRICYVSVEEEFAGHEAYSENPYINEVMSPSGQELTIGLTSSYSMHPNIEGARAYARCVQAKINELENGIPDEGWYEPYESDYGRVAFALDVSGDIPTSAIEQSSSIVNSIIDASLDEDAGVSLATYDNKAYIISQSTNDRSLIDEALSDIHNGGGSNIAAGLEKAYSLLDNPDIKQRVLVLTGNGIISSGLSGQELITYADTIKNTGVTIYVIGFYHGLSNDEKTNAQELMSSIASDGHYYDTSDNLAINHVVEDIRTQVTKPRYINIEIACPVDVRVQFNGEELNSDPRNQNTKTDFGTLTFHDNPNGSTEPIMELNLEEGNDYDVLITGYGDGEMKYTLKLPDENREYSDVRVFRYVPITRDTVIDTVASFSDTTVMNVDMNGDGEIDRYYTAQPNSTAVLTIIEKAEENIEETIITEEIPVESELLEESTNDEHPGNFFILIIPVIAVGACIGGGIFFIRKKAKKKASQE